jgi:formate dehydrogenase subunit gamma
MDGDEMAVKELRRFSTFRVVEHYLVILLVGILVVTGLSQKFYGLDISEWFILKCGGIDNVRLIHRYTGFFFLILTVVHALIGIVGVVVNRWQPSMMINKNDFSDAVHNLRYYIGLVDAPAKCDRYDFKQKFEYWAILVGAFLMIGSGLILWFPMLATRFLPGEIVPAAKALHTNEASVLFILVAIWHIYNSIFSPEVFPLDSSIFTGKISRERMLREHPLELARLEGVGPDGSEGQGHTKAQGGEEEHKHRRFQEAVP